MEKDTTALLARIPLFRDLSGPEMEQVAQLAIFRYYARKSVIFAQGDEKEAVHLIRDGLVKTIKTDEFGHEQIVSFLKPGDMFPHTGFFTSQPYPATAVAITDVRLAAIPIRQFEQLLLQMPSIAVKVMRVMGEKIAELQERLQTLTGQDVRHRVVSFLLELAERHGEARDGRIAINLPMTNQEFANAVGSTRETVNRMLNQLEKDQILKTDRSRIVILDPEALRRLRDEP
ncbi:MAG TPA: Crp/Fnr family transcriptional regulator [Paenibacillaceae bacterium]